MSVLLIPKSHTLELRRVGWMGTCPAWSWSYQGVQSGMLDTVTAGFSIIAAHSV